MSIYEPHKCQTYWGSHGCRKLRDHRGGHACRCGSKISPNGLDSSGFAWGQYGEDFDDFLARGGLAITEPTAACRARMELPRVNLSSWFITARDVTEVGRSA